VLISYLDDSGTDPVSSMIVVAGYVGHYPNWVMFENKARPILADENVSMLHGKELYQTKPPFDGWSMKRKHEFVLKLQEKLATAALFGVVHAVRKENFVAAKQRDKNLSVNESAFGTCFRAVADTILNATPVAKAIKSGQKLSFILEQGNKNNHDALRIYNEFNRELGFSLGGLSFASKNSSVSLQMADLLAYYLRRYANGCDRAGTYVQEPEMIKILKRGKIPVSGIVAVGFERGKSGKGLLLSDAGFRRASRGDTRLKRPLE
jgi:Protein of unknown function (DUF3800)